MQRLYVVFFILATNSLFGAGSSNIWCFGEYTGLNFSDADSTVSIDTSAMNALEGSAVISDSSGNLLFYTDGLTVWNKEHAVMVNGSGLFGHFSAAQSAMIIKKPDSENKYIIFTASTETMSLGFRYSEVDMDMDSGRGGVTTNKNIFVRSPVTEMLTAVRHSNGIDMWVVIHVLGSKDFEAYLITKDGLQTDPVVSNVGSYIPLNVTSGMGQLKVSSDGKRLVMTTGLMGTIELFDFDNTTGRLTSRNISDKGYGSITYGCEFSPDNSMLYMHYSNKNNVGVLEQFDLVKEDRDGKLVGEIIWSKFGPSGSLQIGSDMKIYMARYNQPYVSVIRFPNEQGQMCGFVEEGVLLDGKKCQYGLPNFLPHQVVSVGFSYSTLCAGDTISFFPYVFNVDSIKWLIRNDSEISFHEVLTDTLKYVFPDSGVFHIGLSVFKSNKWDTVQYRIYNHQVPKLYRDVDTLISDCSKLPYILEVDKNEKVECLWQDGSDDTQFQVVHSGNYVVQFSFNNCRYVDSVGVELDCPPVLVFPNVFTPNDDGINDLFVPIELKNAWNVRLRMYNRWGKETYKSSSGDIMWNGTLGETKVAIGVYFWVVLYQNFAGEDCLEKGSVFVSY